MALTLGLLFTTIAAEGFLRLTDPTWREYFSGRLMTIIQVPEYGNVRIGMPGFDGYQAQNNGDFRVHIKVNAIGLRNAEPVSAANGQVWTMGDSMTFGFGVEHNETYAEQLQEILAQNVYNMAGPGNDVCGYFAMAKRLPAEIRPKAIVLGLSLENDVRPYDCSGRIRKETQESAAAKPPSSQLSLTEVKQFLTENSALYNFVVVSVKQLDFLNEILIAGGLMLREHTEKPHLGAEKTAEFAALTALELSRLRKLYPDVPFTVLMIPARLELRDSSGSYKDLRETVSANIRNVEISVIDPFRELKKAGFRKVHFLHDGHWTPRGHAIAAKAVSDWMKAALAGQI